MDKLKTMRTEAEMLACWKQLAGDTHPEPWTEDHLGMFFQRFRPHGDGVAEALTGVMQGEEILPRLLQVYGVTATGGENDMYFVVRQPEPLTARQAMVWTKQHLDNLQALARWMEGQLQDPSAPRPTVAEVHPQELLSALSSVQEIEVVAASPTGPDRGDIACSIYEFVGDLMSYLRWEMGPIDSHALLLEEAFYLMAADYTLAYHILWPLYQQLVPVPEPFLPYFELWKHGVGLQFLENSTLQIQVPHLLSDGT